LFKIAHFAWISSQVLWAPPKYLIRLGGSFWVSKH